MKNANRNLIMLLLAATLTYCSQAKAQNADAADTQVQLLNVETPAQTATDTNKHYLVANNVPLTSIIKMLAKESGLNYFQSSESKQAIGDDKISLSMQSPNPESLLNDILKMKGLELYHQGDLYSVREFTNTISCYVHKLKDNFFENMTSGGAEGVGSGNNGGGTGGNTGNGGGYNNGGNGTGGGGTITASISANNDTFKTSDKWLKPLKDLIKEKGVNNQLIYNPEKQLLILYGTESANQKLTRYLQIVDSTKNPNIYICVRIYSTSSNPMLNLGVDWSSTLSQGATFKLNNPTGTSGTNGTTLSAVGKELGNPLSSIIQTPQLQAVLNFFASDSKAKAVSSPSALTANDREVAFGATTMIPYIGGSGSTGVNSVSGGNTSGNSYNTTSFVQVGTTIHILPRIQSGNRLRIATTLSISQLDAMIPVSAGDGSSPREVPETSGKAYAGEYTINSGETIVIAGLRQNQQTTAQSKVPFFGDVPFVGRLFRNESDSKNVAYLTIFITAKIIHDGDTSYAAESRLTPDDLKAKDNTSMTAAPNASTLTDHRWLEDAALKNAARSRINNQADALQKKAEQEQMQLNNENEQKGAEKVNSTQEEKEIQEQLNQTIQQLNSLNALNPDGGLTDPGATTNQNEELLKQLN